VASARKSTKLADLKKGNAVAGFIAPQLATLVSGPPKGDDWVHEIEFDGYRLLAVIADGHVNLYTRAANDWSDRFKPLCNAFTKLKCLNAVIDGEVVHVAEDGSMSFHALQNALSTEKLDRLRYYAFDLLHLNGNDLRARPLSERKSLLKRRIAGLSDRLLYSEHFAEPGEEILTQACKLALEGIVSKRADAPYHSGRTESWLKSKCIKEQELVVGGYTERPKHPGTLGALLVGYFEGDELRFAGKVGTGFTQAKARSSSREPQSSAIPGAGEREPPKEPSSSPHRARIRCSTELAGWPDRTDDRHRAGESQNRPAESCLQHPPAGDAGTDGCRIGGVVCPARPTRAVPAPNTAYSRQIMSQNHGRGRTGDQFDEKIIIVRGARRS
jgi:bifunctional non-homologous end joining protein LigD